MRERCELRVDEEFADRLFAPEEGILLGDDIRKVMIATDDPRFPQVGRLQAELRAKVGRPLFYGWNIYHRYSAKELESAELFYLMITAACEPVGRDCGTVYDDSTACPMCGAGRKRVSELVLDLRKAPKTKGIARTIAPDEWIVSQHLAQLMMDAELTGFELRPVRHKARYEDDPVDMKVVPSGRELLRRAREAGVPYPIGEFWVWLNRPEQKELNDRVTAEHAQLLARKAQRRPKPLPVWHELRVTSRPVPTVPPTRFGIDPFDDDPEGEHRCPLGHVSGLNLLSEVSVSRKDWDGSDIVCTQDMVGCRRGELVPASLLLISPRFWRLLREHKIKGYSAEVAYLV